MTHTRRQADEIQDMIHDTTQPVVLGVGAVAIAGFTLDELLVIGTLVLLCINIPIAAIRLYKTFKNWRDT
jgi:hypothetical protein